LSFFIDLANVQLKNQLRNYFFSYLLKYFCKKRYMSRY